MKTKPEILAFLKNNDIIKTEFTTVEVFMGSKATTPLDVTIGALVRTRRISIGMSQDRLGELLGLTFQQVQKYEKGINRIGAGRLGEIAAALGVPAGFFYEESLSKPGGEDLEIFANPYVIAFARARARHPGAPWIRAIMELVRTLDEPEVARAIAAE